jgi:phosphatidate phosphatase APP1
MTLRAQLRRGAREFAAFRRGVKRKLGVLAPLRVTLYGGYGRPTEVCVRGRVLEEHDGDVPTPGDRRLRNFKRAFSQFESDEVPGVEVTLTVHGTRARVITDDDGYFFVRLPLRSGAPGGWLDVEATVTATPYPISSSVTARGSVLIPHEGARFGVISDIDDTILRSHVGNKAKLLYLTLLGNALTRLSFEGTTELYQGLLAGGGNAPFFYVSKSMWNIFPLLEHFIDHQKLPRGPLLLRDIGLLNDRRTVPHKAHAIAEILGTYPEKPFVLIGDSGEQDLQIYLRAARECPGRIATLLIRNVSSGRRAAELRELAQREAPPGCPALVFDSSEQAIEHCTELGLWSKPVLAPAVQDATLSSVS